MAIDKENFRLKHPELWIVAFIIVVAIASVSFAYACSNYNKQDPGLYEIVPLGDDEVKYYGSDYSFYYYFDGEINVTTEKNTVTNSYSNKLKEIYACLDEDNTYNSYISIAKINEHPNEEVEVGSYLYATLKDAYKKTSESTNYSLFASPLYSFWYQQFSFDRSVRESNDPENSEASKTYLQNVADYINDKEQIDLVFVSEGKVMLKVSNEYIAFREENNITSPYMSLNILKNSYVLQGISAFLNENKLDKGFIVATDGNVVQLNNSTLETYSIYSVSDLTIYLAASAVFNSNPTCGSVYRRFNLNSTTAPNYYYFTKGEATYFRSLYIDISNGLQNNFLFSSAIYQKDNDILNVAYINNELIPLASRDEVSTYMEEHNLNEMMIMINLINEPKTLYVSKSVKENINLNDKLDYNLNIIKED